MHKKKLILLIIIIIIISLPTITITNIKTNYELKNLGFNPQNIKLIKQKLNKKQINYIIKNNYNNSIMNYITTSYFNINNLQRYINYNSNNENLNSKQVVTYVNIGLDNKFYTNIKNIKNPNDINVLVNKYYKLDKNYVPKDLELLSTQYATTEQYLRKNAKEGFIKMAKDATKENIYFYAGSTYRSYNYQNNLYNKYIIENSFTETEKYSARPGHSEHQTGLAVDILNHNWAYLNNNNIEYSWLIENSYKYGFILRYPKNKEHITGYSYEPWHFRYLNKNIAKIIHNNNLTYEEYIAMYKQ